MTVYILWQQAVCQLYVWSVSHNTMFPEHFVILIMSLIAGNCLNQNTKPRQPSTEPFRIFISVTTSFHWLCWSPEGSQALLSKGLSKAEDRQGNCKTWGHCNVAVIVILKTDSHNLLLASVRTKWVVIRDFFSLTRSPFVSVCMMKCIMQMMTLST